MNKERTKEFLRCLGNGKTEIEIDAENREIELYEERKERALKGWKTRRKTK